MKTDGSQLTKLFDGYSSDINIYNDWLYFGANENGNSKLYKVKRDGTNLNTVFHSSCSNVIIHKDMIYFSTPDGIWKMNLDGKQLENIYKKKVLSFNTSNNLLIYSDYDDNASLYSMDLDGKNNRKLNNDSSHDINIVGDWIFYRKYTSEEESASRLYKMKLDWTRRQKVK